MKRLLTISIGLNICLLSSLSVFMLNKPKYSAPINPVAHIEPQEQMAISAASITPDNNENKPFHWGQLQATDYHVYVQNLRQIGCPELALRAIVTADLDVIYTEKENTLETELAELQNNNSWTAQLESLDTQKSLKAKLQKLPEEEAAEIARLLGLEPVLAQADVPATTSRPRSHRNQSNASVQMPLVFENIDLSALNLNSDQVQAIDDLRQNFLKKIGTEQNPNDPTYRERWQKAQPEIDNELRGIIGTTTFENYQLAASENSD